ncbi:MAG: hypothetical protein KGI67_09190 [Pseudomonadota bacterium]|nr:hypothetical protein [Pseudomonadota bacterium]
MHLDAWTLGLQAINALVLVWLLSRLLFNPVAQLIAARQDGISQSLDAAAKARSELAAVQEQTIQLRATQASVLERQLLAAREARSAAEQAAQAALDQNLHARQQSAELEFQALRAAARREGEAQALDFSLDLARRLLQGLPDELRVLPFLPGLAQALGRIPPEVLSSWCSDTAIAELRVAHPLDEAGLAVCRDTLQDAIATAGTLPALRMVVDPGLLAGLELASAHLQVANHLRQDWERLREHLLADDDD